MSKEVYLALLFLLFLGYAFVAVFLMPEPTWEPEWDVVCVKETAERWLCHEVN
jgi:hypothetical protein